MTIKIGDPITVLDEGSTHHTHVDRIYVDGSFMCPQPGPFLPWFLALEYEGVYWLRGHHAPDSDEVRASFVVLELSK
jgi:hypothetical protein